MGKRNSLNSKKRDTDEEGFGCEKWSKHLGSRRKVTLEAGNGGTGQKRGGKGSTIRFLRRRQKNRGRGFSVAVDCGKKTTVEGNWGQGDEGNKTVGRVLIGFGG